MRTETTGVVHASYELATPEDFFNAVSGATLRAEFLGRRPAAARIERFIGPHWALDYFEAGMKARVFGPLLSGWASVCLVLHDTDSRMYGLPCGPGRVLCNPPDTPIEGCIVPGFRGVAVSVPRRTWEECLAAAGSEPLPGFCIAHLPSSMASALASAFAALRECLCGRQARCAACETPAETGEHLVRELVTLACEFAAKSRPATASARNRHRLARRVETWIRDHAADPIAVPDICRAFGVSRRELEYAFRNTFSESPRAYLHALRLNTARAALRAASPGSTVTSIALAHGFTHLGRFANDFQAHFGEAPSQALRRRK